MPQVTVYIRDDDLDKWKAVEKKSEFIHNALNKHEPDAYLLSPKFAEENPELVKTFDKIATSIKPCKHGYDPRMCKFAKNGKPCK